MKVNDVNEFLSSCGFTLTGIVNDKELRKTYLEPEGLGQLKLAVGECLGFTEAGSSRK